MVVLSAAPCCVVGSRERRQPRSERCSHPTGTALSTASQLLDPARASRMRNASATGWLEPSLGSSREVRREPAGDVPERTCTPRPNASYASATRTPELQRIEGRLGKQASRWRRCEDTAERPATNAALATTPAIPAQTPTRLQRACSFDVMPVLCRWAVAAGCPSNTGDKLRGGGPGSSPAGPRQRHLAWGFRVPL